MMRAMRFFKYLLVFSTFTLLAHSAQARCLAVNVLGKVTYLGDCQRRVHRAPELFPPAPQPRRQVVRPRQQQPQQRRQPVQRRNTVGCQILTRFGTVSKRCRHHQQRNQQQVYITGDSCESTYRFCVNDKIQTKKGFKGRIIGVLSNDRLSIKFRNQTLPVSASAISHVISENSQPIQLGRGDHKPVKFDSALHVEVENIARTSGCDYTYCFRMKIYERGSSIPLYVWKTSPGSPGHTTPVWQKARITRVTDANYKSGAYPKCVNGMKNGQPCTRDGGAPMPYAIFFNNTGIAIHGSSVVTGDPESKGCLRLTPANARTFYNLVQQVGRENVTLNISHTRPL